MSEPKPGREEEEASEPEDASELAARSDVDGLLELARAYRAGTAPGGRDMKKCFEAYRAAADLGSAEAEHATALFVLTGSVVAQDLKEGATRLRSAAEKGSVPARVYLGNLYELGIHYKVDPEKADVWYRNAARAARIEDEPGSESYAASLAELGCVRYVLAKVESGAASEDEKARLLAKARAHGYGLRLRDASGEVERLTLTPALDAAGATAPAAVPAPSPPVERLPPPKLARSRAETVPDAPASKRKPQPTAKGEPKTKTKTNRGNPFAAFGYTLLFASAGVGAAAFASAGARELVLHHGVTLPLPHASIFPLVVFVLGVVPAVLVYRASAAFKAQAVGLAGAGLGWVAWGVPHGAVHASRVLQATGVGLAAFLAAVFVLGLLGGTKTRS